jgi:hypothetical protein
MQDITGRQPIEREQAIAAAIVNASDLTYDTMSFLMDR